VGQLAIPDEVFQQMVAQARAEAPVEACGILAGNDGAVARLYTMTNTDNSPEHFRMDPAEQFDAVRAMRAAGTEMLAIYHSHPASPARPSAEDIRFGLMPDVTYVILSLAGDVPVVKGFQICDDQVAETPVTITKE